MADDRDFLDPSLSLVLGGGLWGGPAIVPIEVLFQPGPVEAGSPLPPPELTDWPVPVEPEPAHMLPPWGEFWFV